MDESTLLHRFPGGVVGSCPDCGDDRLLLPADEVALEYCCVDCDGAVLLVELEKRPRATRLSRVS